MLVAGVIAAAAVVLGIALGALHSSRSGQRVRRWVAAIGDGVADGLLSVRTAAGVVVLSVIATLGQLELFAAAVAYGVLALVSCLPGAGVLVLGRIGSRRGVGDPAPTSDAGSPSRGGAD